MIYYPRKHFYELIHGAFENFFLRLSIYHYAAGIMMFAGAETGLYLSIFYSSSS